MDSGRNKIYEAQCHDIKYDLGGDTIASPDSKLTPAYYTDQKYLAWFELGPISEAEPNKLKAFTYCRVEGFVTDNSRYSEFYGKQVHSSVELQQQNRTIWFVRAFRQNDKTHEIQLLDANRVAPSD